MKLIVESPSRNLNVSIAYYKQLGFHCKPFKQGWLCHAKQLTILLNPDPYSRPCIHLFETEEDSLGVSPSGTWVKQLTEKGTAVNTETESSLGNYAGVCLETLDLKASFNFWQDKGFQGTFDPTNSWCTLTHKTGDSISLLKAHSCPHLFTNPALAFFNGQKNKAIIQGIRKLALPIGTGSSFWK